jgi:4-diphosphocytidyl-2-C-methyl-D-erythritol kinase
MIETFAPAKVNLTLEVLGKRPDGYHEVRSVIQTIGLGDYLRFEPGAGLQFHCASSSWHSEDSLVARAVNLLKKETSVRQGAIITVEKRVPLLSGLGGDSSDAAAAMQSLNRFWGLGLSPERLAELAAGLGSDIPFFLHGDTALVTGKGETVIPLPPFPHNWVVLLVPPVARLPGKTGRLYATLCRKHYTDGQITERLVSKLDEGNEPSPFSFFNVFDAVADECFEGLVRYREEFLNAGAPWVHLVGSGPALYTLTRCQAVAERIYCNLRGGGRESYLTETLASLDNKGVRNGDMSG